MHQVCHMRACTYVAVWFDPGSVAVARTRARVTCTACDCRARMADYLSQIAGFAVEEPPSVTTLPNIFSGGGGRFPEIAPQDGGQNGGACYTPKKPDRSRLNDRFFIKPPIVQG